MSATIHGASRKTIQEQPMSKGSKPAALKSPTGAQPKAPKVKAAPPVADDDDEPVDMEALRIDLSRHIATLGHYARTCPEPQCRRARRCLNRKLSCHRVHPPPQLTPEQESRWMAYVQHAIKRRLAELEAQGEGG
jgi:hypothetical protein